MNMDLEKWKSDGQWWEIDEMKIQWNRTKFKIPKEKKGNPSLWQKSYTDE